MPFLETSLPFATRPLGGVGGRLKETPDDFLVTEVPLYEPSGEGDHLYLDIERRGMETRMVLKRLAEAFDVNPADIGCAGQKDKQAVARQWFSLPWRMDCAETAESKLAACPELILHQALRHQNKLRRGHNLGNRFVIRLRGVSPDATLIGEIADKIRHAGIPNFFGPQRFGGDGRNAEVGKALLLGRRIRSRSQRTLMLNAWQSELFNRWLARRIELTGLDQALIGDIARVEGRGGLFVVKNAEAESDRLVAHDIQLTGPMFGAKMMAAEHEAGTIEGHVIGEEALPAGTLKKARLVGSRRPARILLKDLRWHLEGKDLILSFFLPKGSYATVAVREFTK